MSYTQINARIIDQTIQLSNTPLLASGSEGVLQVNCTFDSLWDGYGKTAVFYRTEDEVYHVPMAQGVATIPHEVTAEEGYFFFGVMGVAGNTRTTEVVRMELKQGAITLSSAETVEPTPNIYLQLLAAYGELDTAVAVEHGRVNQLVAMRGEGPHESPLSAEYVSGTIKTNGSSAYISITISSLSLTAGGHHYTDYCLMPGQAPLGPVMMESSNPDLDVTIEAPAANGWSRILIENPSSEMFEASNVTFATAFYPLAEAFNSELADLRIDIDGQEHDGAAEAVRSQILVLHDRIDNIDNGSSGAAPARLSNVTLRASAWTGADSLYSQVVSIAGVTAYSKVDLLPSVEQLAIFHNKDVAFVTENEDGVVTVYAIGDKPTLDYTMQVSITEVVV